MNTTVYKLDETGRHWYMTLRALNPHLPTLGEIRYGSTVSVAHRAAGGGICRVTHDSGEEKAYWVRGGGWVGR